VKRFIVYLYVTARGDAVVANKLGTLAKSSPQTFQAIQTGVAMLEEFGPDPNLNKFKRLRHVERGVELWELRAQAKPAYRVLFSLVPGEDAYVLLHAVAKADFEKDPERYVTKALEHMDHWLAEVHKQPKESP
jgi:hypothetical protein